MGAGTKSKKSSKSSARTKSSRSSKTSKSSRSGKSSKKRVSWVSGDEEASGSHKSHAGKSILKRDNDDKDDGEGSVSEKKEPKKESKLERKLRKRQEDCYCFFCYYRTCKACINYHQLNVLGLIIVVVAEILFLVALIDDEWATSYPQTQDLLNIKITYSITGACEVGYKGNPLNRTRRDSISDDPCKVLFEYDTEARSYAIMAMILIGCTALCGLLMFVHRSAKFFFANVSGLTTAGGVGCAIQALIIWGKKVRDFLFYSNINIGIIATGTFGYSFVIYSVGTFTAASGGLFIFISGHWDVPCPCATIKRVKADLV